MPTNSKYALLLVAIVAAKTYLYMSIVEPWRLSKDYYKFDRW